MELKWPVKTDEWVDESPCSLWGRLMSISCFNTSTCVQKQQRLNQETFLWSSSESVKLIVIQFNLLAEETFQSFNLVFQFIKWLSGQVSCWRTGLLRMLTCTAPVYQTEPLSPAEPRWREQRSEQSFNPKCHQTSPSLIWGQLRIIEVKASASITTNHPFHLNSVSHLINN